MGKTKREKNGNEWMSKDEASAYTQMKSGREQEKDSDKLGQDSKDTPVPRKAEEHRTGRNQRI